MNYFIGFISSLILGCVVGILLVVMDNYHAIQKILKKLDE